jgi:hypothetical protein
MNLPRIKSLRKRVVGVIERSMSQVYARSFSQLACYLASRDRWTDKLITAIVNDVVQLDQSGQATALSWPQGRLSILGLSPNEFRQDVEVLATRPELRVMRMPGLWQ